MKDSRYHGLDDTFALGICGSPDMCYFQTSPFKHLMHLLFGTLHRTEGSHHVQVLVGHECGSMLRRDYPLIDEYFTVG